MRPVSTGRSDRSSSPTSGFDHSSYEYVRGNVTTNKAENYFSDGTHHHVSTAHLPRYLAEFDYRYTTRKDSDQQRFASLMGQVGGKRLTYRSTTA
jgi:hypothetical protein